MKKGMNSFPGNENVLAPRLDCMIILLGELLRRASKEESLGDNIERKMVLALSKTGLSQEEIAQIVGVGTHKVNDILKKRRK